eukprot:gene4999-3594_t
MAKNSFRHSCAAWVPASAAVPKDMQSKTEEEEPFRSTNITIQEEKKQQHNLGFSFLRSNLRESNPPR